MAADTGTDPGAPTEAAPSAAGRPARGHRKVIALVVVVVLVAAFALWTDHQANKYYVFQPGTAPRLTTSADCRVTGAGDLRLSDGTPCARIVVPAGREHTLDGTLLMVDVLVGKATPTEYILHELGLLDHFHRGSQLIPNANVLGTTPASQLTCQDNQEMVGATTAAPVAALQRLGYDVQAVNHGAQVAEVLPGSAAARAGIQCNDLVTAINGHAVQTVGDVTANLAHRAPGAAVAVTVRRSAANGKTTTLTIHATLGTRPAVDGRPAEPKVGFLGVVSMTDTTYHLPFHVEIDVGNIGGPSAGLALTLALLDVLSSGKLTGGHVVAATGTISTDGAVGDVGGVAQKTVAVEKAGAQLFLVPPQEYKAAESKANGKMKIKAVSTLTQALAALEGLGGQIPAPAH